MTNRKPMYDNKSGNRVISGPNGTYVAQRRVADKGTREQSNWENIQRPTSDLNLAKRQAGFAVQA